MLTKLLNDDPNSYHTATRFFRYGQRVLGLYDCQINDTPYVSKRDKDLRVRDVTKYGRQVSGKLAKDLYYQDSVGDFYFFPHDTEVRIIYKKSKENGNRLLLYVDGLEVDSIAARYEVR